MSHQRSPKHKAKKRSGSRSNFAPTYIVFAVGGAGIWLLAWLFTEGQQSTPILLGYVAAVVFLAHMAALGAYRGRRLSGWQKALAALPLRAMGFGTKGGRPVTAAHGDARVPRALVATGLVSLVVIGALAIWLIPEFRGAR